MKRFFTSLTVVAMAFLAIACARHKIIPDETLAKIFHDAFLTNAYLDHENIEADTLNFYEPIFQKYGYTIEDVRFTIGNFSKRKSARLGDVVEVAIAQLEKQGKLYEKEVAVLDTIDNTAQRLFTRTIYTDSLVRIKKLKDSTNRVVVIDDLRSGEYKISFGYKLDSLDDNIMRKTGVWFEREDGTKIGLQQITLRKTAIVDQISRTLTFEEGAVRLVIDLYQVGKLSDNAANKKKKKHTGLTVTNLQVTHIPTVKDAVDSLYAKQLVIKIFADEFLSLINAQDSLASGAVTLRDSI